MWLACATAGWLFGLVLGAWTTPAVAAILVPLACFTVFWAARRRRRVLFLGCLLLAAMAAGILRGSLDRPGASPLAPYEGRHVVLRGVVDSAPEPLGRAVRFRVRVKDVRLDAAATEVAASVQVTARMPVELALQRDLSTGYMPGDIVQLSGVLETPLPFQEVDVPALLARENIRHVMTFPDTVLVDTGRAHLATRALFAVRMALARGLDRSLPEPEVGLAKAFLLGIRQSPPDVDEAFRRSGAAHLLSISGAHISVLLAALVIALKAVPVGRRWFLDPLPVAVIWLYILLAGSPVSAERAAIMATFYLAAGFFGRQRNGLAALLWAAFLITAVDPSALQQVSFQLSFAAMAGILLAGLPVVERLPRWPGLLGAIGRWAAIALVVGTAASLFTAPALAYHFGRLSLLSAPASALAMVAMPAALVASLFAGIAGAATPIAAWLIGWAAWVPLQWTVLVVNWFAAIPVASLDAPLNAPGATVAYAAIGACAWLLQRWHREVPAESSSPEARLKITDFWFPASAAVIGLGAILVWSAALGQRAPSGVTVQFLDVPLGQAALLTTPRGTRVLIDGGSDPRRLRSALDATTGYFGQRLDLVVVTSPQPEQAAGLYLGLTRYTVGGVIGPAGVEQMALRSWDAANAGDFSAWKAGLAREGVAVAEVSKGALIDLGGGVMLEVISPSAPPLVGTASDLGNNSLVFRLRYGAVSILFAGGVPAFGQGFLLSEGTPVAANVLAMSGAAASPEFLRAVRPQVVVVTSDNPKRTLSAADVDWLRAALPTAQALWPQHRQPVTVQTDGSRLWAKGAGYNGSAPS